jgi:hypothetical protein
MVAANWVGYFRKFQGWLQLAARSARCVASSVDARGRSADVHERVSPKSCSAFRVVVQVHGSPRTAARAVQSDDRVRCPRITKRPARRLRMSADLPLRWMIAPGRNSLVSN